MSTSSKSGHNWWDDFDGIVIPQGAPALVWRGLMRLMPLFVQSIYRSSATVNESPSAQSIFALMHYPFVLDLAYRTQQKLTPIDTRQTAIAGRFEKMLMRLEDLQQGPGASNEPWFELFRQVVPMLKLGGDASPTSAQTAIREVNASVPPRVRQNWDTAMEMDLAVFNRIEGEPDDLKKLLSNPLWPEPVSEILEVAQFANYLLRDSKSYALLDILRAHLTAPLPWDRALELLSSSADQTVPAAQAKEIEAIASDRSRLARFLARMALKDRTRLDLAAAPSVSGFREFLDRGHVRREDVPALEERLASEQAGFEPSPIWLAWVQTVHRASLESIEAELKSWLGLANQPASVSKAGFGEVAATSITDPDPAESATVRPETSSSTNPRANRSRATVKKRK